MKGAVKATGNAMKGAAKTVVKGAIAGTAKAASAAKKAVSSVKRMASIAAAAIPVCVNKAGAVAKKAVGAVSKCVDAGIQKGKQAVDSLKKGLGELQQEFSERNKNLGRRVQEEWENYWQKIERGMTEKGIFYSPIKGLSDTLDFTLQLRKAVVEEYPILNWTERKLQGAYQWAKDGFISNSDKFGNYIYNKNWGVVSNFVGGLFNASDMKDNSGVAVAAGSFFNGVLGHGVLGTVDGVATAVTNPFGTIEGINNVVGDPGAAFSALKKEAVRIWDEELVNGSWEDRSRVVGAGAFEVVTTVVGASAAKAGKAAKAAKAGDKAADLGKAARVADAIDDAADAAKAAKVADAIDDVADAAKAARKAGKLSGALDRASDVGKASRAALSSIKKSASGMIDRALTSNTVKNAAKKADDFIRDVRNMLTPPELQPALVTGFLDDADDVGFFTKYYDDLVKKKKPSLSESGVKIEKAEIVGGSGDVVDGAGDLGGGVKKGGSGAGDIKKVKYGDHFEKKGNKKVLKPNVEYIDSNGYKYTTDNKGRISKVEGTLKSAPGTRNPYAQRTVGGTDRLPTDDGGHLIGTQFNGSGEIDNLVPQSSNINRAGGEWYKMEQTWKEAIKERKTVEVDIRPIYSNSSSRPDSFAIQYKINGKVDTKLITNE